MGAAAGHPCSASPQQPMNASSSSEAALVLESMMTTFMGATGRASGSSSNVLLCCKKAAPEEEVIMCKTRAAMDDSTAEVLMHQLFCLQDLSDDGVLDEEELVCLNQEIARLHHGSGVDVEKVRQKFVGVFRERLSPTGEPVSYQTFRSYLVDMLESLDSNVLAQEMILEQFVAEAAMARAVMHEQDGLTCSTMDDSDASGSFEEEVDGPPEHNDVDESTCSSGQTTLIHDAFNEEEVLDDVFLGGVPLSLSGVDAESDYESDIEQLSEEVLASTGKPVAGPALLAL